MTAPPSLTASNLHPHQLRAAPAATTIPLRGRPTHHLSPTGGGPTHKRASHTQLTLCHTHTHKKVGFVQYLVSRF
jgi:hypothetical protein